MKYDASLIKTKTVVIGGKEIPLEKIPSGMSGPNGAIYIPTRYDEEEQFAELGFNKDPVLSKELEEYMQEGIEPDSDEVRAIKEEIEKEHCEELLEVLENEDLEEQ